MRPLTWPALMIVLALAGCAGTGATTSSGPDQPAAGWSLLRPFQTSAAPEAASAEPARASVLPASTVSGRQACPTAANGAPNCGEGAVLLCQSKGYRTGTAVDIDQARGCTSEEMRRRLVGQSVTCSSTYHVRRAICR
jgi:hypothetical protein